VLTRGDLDEQRKIFTRTIRSVTWMREEGRLELRLTLPEPEPEEARVETVRARGGSRTHTVQRDQSVLSRSRLPVTPPGRGQW
jgi:hypothetical protein